MPQIPMANADPRNSSDTLLEVRDLRTSFLTEDASLPAVQGISLTLRKGKILALVGESGCGKSVTAYSFLQLLRHPGKIVGGSIRYHPPEGPVVDLAQLQEGDEELYRIRGAGIGMVFQEPMTALSPVHTIGNQLMEALLLHQNLTPDEAREKVIAMLRRVGIPAPENRLQQYPFEFSGGMRQRVVIAMALLNNPPVIIADEPTTALDVTIQAQILNLLMTARDEGNRGILLITHDLGVVAQTADEVAVMYLGKIVEQGPVREVLRDPRHPYTRGLLQSLPGLHHGSSRLATIPGSVPPLTNIPSGCPFHPRCPAAQAGRCDQGGPPESREIAPQRTVACLREEEIRGEALWPAPPDDPDRSADDPTSTADPAPIIRFNTVGKAFSIGKKSFFRRIPPRQLHAVSEVTLDLYPGETLGLVGESGSGKTTLARTLLGAFPPTSGTIHYHPDEHTSIPLHTLNHKQWKPLRRDLQMIFQDPFSSLNPRFTVEEIVGEPLLLHERLSRREIRQRVKTMLSRVGLNPDMATRYPHAFSGGQRQRIGIARALILEPRLIVADEAVSALDVSVQAQIINLLKDLQEEMRLTTLFVAHDLSVVRHLCDRVAVMYAGRLVEVGPAAELFAHPRHPYTRLLLSSVPDPDPSRPMNRQVTGEPADPSHLPTGCAFHPRCPECFAPCTNQRPELTGPPNHRFACWLESPPPEKPSP